MTNKSLPMPITVKPYLHQQQAFDFACMRFGLLPSDFRSNGVALLMEMGTGKTITSIGISGILYQFGRVNSILVVAPLSILGVWEEEFEKFAAFPYTLTILKGTSAKKRQQLSGIGKTDGLEIVEFERQYCAGCGKASCDDGSRCPYEDKRNNPDWWLGLEAGTEEVV